MSIQSFSTLWHVPSVMDFVKSGPCPLKLKYGKLVLNAFEFTCQFCIFQTHKKDFFYSSTLGTTTTIWFMEIVKHPSLFRPFLQNYMDLLYLASTPQEDTKGKALIDQCMVANTVVEKVT
jgi:hypothetical protein